MKVHPGNAWWYAMMAYSLARIISDPKETMTMSVVYVLCLLMLIFFSYKEALSERTLRDELRDVSKRKDEISNAYDELRKEWLDIGAEWNQHRTEILSLKKRLALALSLISSYPMTEASAETVLEIRKMEEETELKLKNMKQEFAANLSRQTKSEGM